MLEIPEMLAPSICHVHTHARNAAVARFPNALIRFMMLYQ